MPCIGQRCQGTPYVVKVLVLLVVGGPIAKMCYNLTLGRAKAKIQKAMGHLAQGELISDDGHTLPTTPGPGRTSRGPSCAPTRPGVMLERNFKR